MSGEWPLVSFLIAAYNEQEYIEACIKSCLEQSYPNVEVCITDDGSEDSTWEIIKKMSISDSRIKVDRFLKNRGKVAAFNNSYKLCSGQLVSLMGADDVNYPDRVSSTYNELVNEQAHLVCGGLTFCDCNLNPLDIEYVPARKKLTTQGLLESNSVPGGTIIMTREAADFAFPIPEELKYEDWWIAIRVSLMGKLSLFNSPVVMYRMHANNDNLNINRLQNFKQSRIHQFSRQVNYYRFLSDMFRKEGLSEKSAIMRQCELEELSVVSCLEKKAIRRFIRLAELFRNITLSRLWLKTFAFIVIGDLLLDFKALSGNLSLGKKVK